MGSYLSREVRVTSPPVATTTDIAVTSTTAGLKRYLTKALACPVCYEVKTGRIYQCLNGHNICSSCRPRIIGDKCCLCNAELSSSRNWLAEELTSKLVGIPCRNAPDGCTEVLPQPKMAAHLPLCSFSCSCLVKRVVPSEEPYIDGDCVGCEWRGSRRDLMAHVVAEHPGQASRDVMHMSISDVDMNSLERICNQVCLLESRGQLFWCRLGVYREVRMFPFLYRDRNLTVYAYAQHLKPPTCHGRYSCEYKFAIGSRSTLTMTHVSDVRSLGHDDGQGLQLCKCLVETLISADKCLKCVVSVTDMSEPRGFVTFTEINEPSLALEL